VTERRLNFSAKATARSPRLFTDLRQQAVPRFEFQITATRFEFRRGSGGDFLHPDQTADGKSRWGAGVDTNIEIRVGARGVERV